MATDLFANRPTTTVTSGGTTAPSGGTVESWTVASSTLFPAASSGAGTQFHVADPAQASEIITVTNVSGTTWTVTRGAESTTPVAHAANFTVWEVVSAGDLTAFVQNPMTALGDTIYGGSSGTPAMLPGNTTATKDFLTSTGTGSAANAPSWGTIAAGDVPSTLNATTFSGAVTPSAGITPYSSGFTSFGTGGVANLGNSTAGTSTSMTAGTWYYSALLIPYNVTLTGAIAVTGTTGGTDNWIAALWAGTGGTAVANSSLSGIAAPASNTKKKFAFTGTVAVDGPGAYILGLQSSGTTATFLSFSNAVEGFATGSVGGTFGTVPVLSPAATYTANTGPFASTY